MASPKYTARIVHTERSIDTMFRTQYYTYERLQIVVRVVIGVVLAALALLLSMPMWLRGLLLLAGGWLIGARDFPSQIRAAKAAEGRHGVLPTMEYEFYDGNLRLSGEGSMSISYKKIERLVEDEKYLYLFLSKDSVCMIDKETVRPKKVEELMKLLSEQCKQPWKKEKSLLSLNFYELRDLIREKKGKEPRHL